VDEPCLKLLPPKAQARVESTRAFPRFTDSSIAPSDVLLLHYAYDPETSSPRTRSFIRQIAKAYGEDIPHVPLRHAVLAFASALLPSADFGEQSEMHIQKATQALRRQVLTPSKIHEADLFTAGMLMWVLWIKNRPKNALRHAQGIMLILQQFWAAAKEHPLSDMLTVFGPLVYGEARFYGALGLDSNFSLSLQHRITFKQRMKYQAELILSGSSTVPWLSGNRQALIDALWDLQWLLLSYLLELTSGATEAASRLPAAMEYVMEEYNDRDLQHALAELANWPEADRARHSAIEEEVMDYLCIKKLSIDLLIAVLCAPTTLEGLLSTEVYFIAKSQIQLGYSQRIQREGLAHEFYTWAYVIDLGLAGLALAAYGDGKGFRSPEYTTDCQSVDGLLKRFKLVTNHSLPQR
jgi:hypothetical protein